MDMRLTNLELTLVLREMRRLYLLHPSGLRDSEIAILLRQPYQAIWKYRHKLHVVEVAPGRFTAELLPDEVDYANAVLWRAAHDARRDGDG